MARVTVRLGCASELRGPNPTWGSVRSGNATAAVPSLPGAAPSPPLGGSGSLTCVMCSDTPSRRGATACRPSAWRSAHQTRCLHAVYATAISPIAISCGHRHRHGCACCLHRGSKVSVSLMAPALAAPGTSRAPAARCHRSPPSCTAEPCGCGLRMFPAQGGASAPSYPHWHNAPATAQPPDPAHSIPPCHPPAPCCIAPALHLQGWRRPPVQSTPRQL